MPQRKKMRLIHYFGIGFLAMFSIFFVLWGYEVSREDERVRQARAQVLNMEFVQADTQLRAIENSWWWRMREAGGIVHPHVLLLHGALKGYLGEWDDAERMLIEAITACGYTLTRLIFGDEPCRLVIADAYFRRADLMVEAEKPSAYTNARILYAFGLSFVSDDLDAKRRWEWISIQEKHAKDKELKGDSISRHKHLFQAPDLGTPGKTRKGY